MEEIKFDFNNMFDFNVGQSHGVSIRELELLQRKAKKAHLHLQALIRDPVSRVKLGLEWLRLPYQNKKIIENIRELAREITAKYDNVISLGIGGSYLGLKAAQDALAGLYYNEFQTIRGKRPRIFFEGNNMDPQTISALLANLNAKKTFVIVISKSGETIETKAAFEVVLDWLKKNIGIHYGRQVFAITGPDSGSLRQRVNEEQRRDKASFRNLELLKGIGGRYSEFNMGLLHLALIGVDTKKVLAGARAMLNRCQKPSLYKNPAYLYATLQYILSRKKGKSISILMPFSEGLKSTADWYAQLLAESLGKKYGREIKKDLDGSEVWLEDKARPINSGRTPLICRGTTDLHSIHQNNIEGQNNKTVTFIRVRQFSNNIKIPAGCNFLSKKTFTQLLNLAQEATAWSLTQANRPNCVIILPEVSPFSWGGLLFFFEMATAFEGELLNVNAFNQPGVESYKNYMCYKLGKRRLLGEIKQGIKDVPLIKRKKFII